MLHQCHVKSKQMCQDVKTIQTALFFVNYKLIYNIPLK